jgi:hypothetical protein
METTSPKDPTESEAESETEPEPPLAAILFLPRVQAYFTDRFKVVAFPPHPLSPRERGSETFTFPKCPHA